MIRTGPNQWPVNGHPDHLKEALEGSLRRLKLDRIDLYQLHRFDPKVPIEETLGFLKDAQDKGQIRHIGLSEVTTDQLKQAQELITVVSVQNRYNLLDREWESVVQACQEQNLAFLPWFPLSAGALDNETLKKMAQDKGVGIHQLAIAWLLHHSPVMLPIPGTSTVAHLEENVSSATIQFSDDELATLDQLK